MADLEVEGNEDGNAFMRTMSRKGIRSVFRPNHIKIIDNPIFFKPLRGDLADGYDVEDLIEICDALIEARNQGRLHTTQKFLGRQAEIGTDIVSNYVKGVLYYFSGKKSESEIAMETVERIAQSQIEANDRMDARRHEEAMGLQQLLAMSLDRLGQAAVQYAAPVGRSVDSATFL